MTITTESTMLPVDFVPPLLNPAPGGLVAATSWTEETGPPRWIAEGIGFRGSVTGNFGGAGSSGLWAADWCAQPDDLTETDIKSGTRPGDPEPFVAVTTWATDSCDLTAPSRAEVQQRAQQVLRMREPMLIAAEFAARIKTDAGTPTAATTLVAALAEVEDALAGHNVLGYVHVGPKLLPALVSALLVTRTGAGWRTPGGHTLVVDGGYRTALGDATLVATSAPYGWRNQVEVTTTVQADENLFVALAERSSVIGAEAVLAAAKITSGTP
ncbi:hypothetical protein [Mycolicibacter arupensis]|jgi:uncharacterized protein YuzE|uniref:hypothetical protein n=1 Tax=Mycolicibacter arupensis TaxID=342002 RepID=UPI0023F30BEB|nr:hypothetical protein [Mycolicibacter arupensis]